MSTYQPLFITCLIILTLLLAVAWPWLRRPETREKATFSVLILFFLSVAGYLSIGSPFNTDSLAAQKQQHQAMRVLLAQQQSAIHQTPDDFTPWAKAGAILIEMARYDEAAEHLKEAVKLSDGQPMLILLYGKAQMLAADGKVTEGAKQAFEIAAELMPDNPDPKFMLALERMQAGDGEGARERLKTLLPMLPDSAPMKRMIEQQIKDKGQQAE